MRENLTNFFCYYTFNESLSDSQRYPLKRIIPNYAFSTKLLAVFVQQRQRTQFTNFNSLKIKI